MKIFILGASDSGKSTLANAIYEHCFFSIYEAGAWVIKSITNDANFRKNAELYSKSILSETPNYSYNQYVKFSENILTSPSQIIVGIRNPIDFVLITQYNICDYLLINIVSDKNTKFDEGTNIILNIAEWQINNFVTNSKIINVKKDDLFDKYFFDKFIKNIISLV